MVGRGKAKQACSKESSQRLKEDRISQLPDHLICYILSQIPTKEAVKTSVLSTRWRSLWLWVPTLELCSRKFQVFNAFVSFGDRFFDSSRVSCIDKVKLTMSGADDASCLTPWIDAAVKRKVKHLHVRFPLHGYLYDMPLSLYVCETLVSLTLHLVALVNVEFVSLPCLKTMHLKDTLCHEATFERLVSSCPVTPVLEELEIEARVNKDAKVFRVLSRSLKRLTISIRFSRKDIGSGVVIDAPRLSFVSINDALSVESFIIITNMDSNASLVISLNFSFGFFNDTISSVINRFRSLTTIFKDTIKLIYVYSKLKPLPQFGYTSRLQVARSQLFLFEMVTNFS